MRLNKLVCFWILFFLFSINAYAQFGATNTRPIADAGTDRDVKVGEEVELQGSGSDEENDPLTFIWAIVFKPPVSKAELSEKNIRNPTFTPDKPGDYMFNLKVNDGKLNSLPDTVIYTVKTTLTGNSKPIADAGTDRDVKVGEEVELQGSGSDRDNDAITFRWSILDKPENSNVSLSDKTIQNPKLTPDIVGVYSIQLITDDGKEDSYPATITINAVGHTIVVEPTIVCAYRTCDLNTKKWCDQGVFVSNGYCEHCIDKDYCLSKIGDYCKVDSDCEAGLKCNSWVCSEMRPGAGTIPDDNIDEDVKDDDDIDEEVTDDKKEKGTIFGKMFWVVILIIIFGAGSYLVYYISHLIKPKSKTSDASNFMLIQEQPVVKTPEERREIQEVVKKRRKAKREKREKHFDTFYKKKRPKTKKKS